MPKSIMKGLLALGAAFAALAVFAVIVIMQKTVLEKQNQSMQGQISEYETKERDLTKQVATLNQQAADLRRDMDQRTRDKEAVEKKVVDIQRESDRLSGQVADAQREKKDWETKISTLRREKDDLMEKLKNRPVEERIVEKIVEKIVPGPGAMQQPTNTQSVQPTQTTIVVENKANEEYWAGLLRDKSSLEIQLAAAKQQASESALKVEEAKKASTDLEMELGRLKNEREDILRKIKYGEDLADNLSVELARARNEQRSIQQRAEAVGAENVGLRTEIKQLTSTKVALEKSIARLTDDKNAIEKKLVETENIIQSRIDDIWQIKKDVDARFGGSSRNSSGSVELAPIVVNANVEPTKTAPMRKGGSVVSLNEENNFVIINLGEKDGVRVGDAYKVYRDNKPIGTVSVIQVRKDISAADIKQKTAAFRAGDTVK